MQGATDFVGMTALLVLTFRLSNYQLNVGFNLYYKKQYQNKKSYVLWIGKNETKMFAKVQSIKKIGETQIMHEVNF